MPIPCSLFPVPCSLFPVPYSLPLPFRLLNPESRILSRTILAYFVPPVKRQKVRLGSRCCARLNHHTVNVHRSAPFALACR